MLTPIESGQRALLTAAGVAAFLAVALGAFGAHALERFADESALATWDTATRYLMWHALAAIMLALFSPRMGLPGWLLLAGATSFAGSLYLWVLTGWLPLVMLTPTGGVIMLTGWVAFIWKVMKRP